LVINDATFYVKRFPAPRRDTENVDMLRIAFIDAIPPSASWRNQPQRSVNARADENSDNRRD
jgi:hypothetical protein